MAKSLRVNVRHFVILFALTISCEGSMVQSEKPASNPTGPAAHLDLDGTWIAEDIAGGGVIDFAQSDIAFRHDNRVTGSGGCNRFMGPVTFTGDRLTIGPLASTRMMCAPALMDQEQKFLAALQAAVAFRFDGPFLKFLNADGAQLVRLIRLETH